MSSKRRSTRQAASRKRSQYYEPDTEDDFEAESSASDMEPAAIEHSQVPPHKRQKTATTRARAAKVQTRSRARTNTARAKSNNKPSRHFVGRRRKARKTAEEIAKEKEFRGPTDGRIPDWASLPTDILRDVFVFGSEPLDDGGEVSHSVVWLMKAARTCRAFTTPALEAFYQAPALQNRQQPHALYKLLQEPTGSTYMDYNVKVRSLDIGVKKLAYQATNKPMFDVGDLVPVLPQLQHLQIKHPIDEPPYRPVKCQKWTYPPRLLHNMETCGRRLKTWRWSRDMITPQELGLYEYMTSIHTGKSFGYLEKLVVCGFDVHDSAPQTLPPNADPDMPLPPDLNSSLRILPALRDLTIMSCDLVCDKFFDGLPKTLHRLEISNCHDFNSEMLALYLRDGGSQLRELSLNHNQALDLAFLPSLAINCPKLETLIVDLQFYSNLSSVIDVEPLFDDLLLDDEVPSWPSTMRHLELLHLQKFTAKAATNLFESLVDSAQRLPDLRTLVLQSHISIPWRDRAGFRDQWIERLQRVYLLQSADPLPYLGSLRQFRLWKTAQAQAGRRVVAGDGMLDNIDDLTASDAKPNGAAGVRARLSHVAITPRKPSSGDTDTESDSHIAARKRQPRRSMRVAESQASATPAPDSPLSSISVSDEDEVGDEYDADLFIQGLCTVVDVRIDNQRPRENQFREEDFLDSEQSGDEDWTEGAEEVEQERAVRYAW